MLISAISEPSTGGSPNGASENAHSGPRILRNHRISGDSYSYIADDAAPVSGKIIVGLKRFLAERETLLLRNDAPGVRLDTSQSPELLSDDISRLSLVEIHIPYFKDGRAFSWARLLRSRMQFTGEIRLTGHFLLDQMAFFMRVGVDSFVLPENVSAADVESAIALIHDVYQPSADHRPTIADLRRKTAVRA